MEGEDVFEFIDFEFVFLGLVMDYFNKGFKFVEGILGKLKFVIKFFSEIEYVEINIFLVVLGYLYECMFNIMMVSVMWYMNYIVKFWFIE